MLPLPAGRDASSAVSADLISVAGHIWKHGVSDPMDDVLVKS